MLPGNHVCLQIHACCSHTFAHSSIPACACRCRRPASVTQLLTALHASWAHCSSCPGRTLLVSALHDC